MINPQTYFCQWLGHKISGVAARNCNYLDIENYKCSHDGASCVAKEGLELFAQTLPKSRDSEERWRRTAQGLQQHAQNIINFRRIP